ncbi:MAG TPA: exonuclease domain-containing protein [Woeseiaceae bacterium]|nr:exonuclease domain-containing protein [Woeseiaceae bacterium]
MSTDADFDQTHWVPVQRRDPLPTHYYEAHFEELLAFVEAHYGHVLDEAGRRLIRDFRGLPVDARRLYVRLVNRKGRVFAAERLCYAELGNIAPLLAALRDTGWIRPPCEDDVPELLAFLTRRELTGLLAPLVTGMSKSMKKAELVALATAECPPDWLVATLAARGVFVQRHADAIRFLLFLYFGRVQDSLGRFTMRDLGLVRTHDYKESYEPRFADRGEALENWYFALRLDRLKRPGARTVRALADEAAAWPEPVHAAAAAARDTLAWELGRALEKIPDAEAALAMYRRGESARCSERVARVLLAAARREEARAFLERLIDEPRSDAEALMAEDLYALKFGRKRTSKLTDELRAAQTIELDESLSGAPESAAAAWFANAGTQAFRTENGLWRTLFGLLFWEELFEGADAALHSPFEFLPVSLMDGSFAIVQREAIEQKLALTGRPGDLRRRLLKASTQHYGKPNGVFRWRRSLLEAVFVLVLHAPPAALQRLLRRLCRDYRNARHGYPDLMLADEAGIRFVEIKTDGDQLRQNQFLCLQLLRETGLRADVVRVRWTLDPMQAYAVVDVETTGGPGERHRVTEIGAVKVQGGEIVDRFHTLVNPERSIPAGITRLTGITPAMVAGAPVFADVADALESFLADCIFVAHNVDFDYGFIGREFRRLGRPFRHARLCTCAGMRKFYPGRSSYSLAALCQAFDIELRQHHRAMADAEAAAGLLLLVNERRLEAAGAV